MVQTIYEAQQNARMQAAENANNGINSAEAQDENERIVNGLYLKILAEGYDMLSNEEAEWIQEKAMKCPFVEGSAVYKARTLNAHYKPAEMYDDLKICNAAGVYKQSENNNNGPSKITQENNVLENVKPLLENIRMNDDDFIVYPNPTSNFITVLHQANKESKLNIFDVTGRLVKTIVLEKGKRNLPIDLSELANGIYNYIQVIEGEAGKFGKITKSN